MIVLVSLLLNIQFIHQRLFVIRQDIRGGRYGIETGRELPPGKLSKYFYGKTLIILDSSLIFRASRINISV